MEGKELPTTNVKEGILTAMSVVDSKNHKQQASLNNEAGLEIRNGITFANSKRGLLHASIPNP